jgi:predicted nicotinamide N-methyase
VYYFPKSDEPAGRGRHAGWVTDVDLGLTEGLCLTPVPFVPEIRLYLADDTRSYRRRAEESAYRSAVTPYWAPFWATAWSGGQALARYLIDHPEIVAGKRVLDVATGSGLVAIAAALAGAAEVVANDVDAAAMRAVEVNAHANGVPVRTRYGDVLDTDGVPADLVLVGDVFYSPHLADRMDRFLRRAYARGAEVLVGDPGRPALPLDWLEMIASYRLPMLDAPEDARVTWAHVLRPVRLAGG